MGSSVPNIEDIGIKAEGHLLHNFQEEVAQLLGRKNVHFPGAQPVSFSRRHLEELKTKDYFVSEKSDGIRCLLWFTEQVPEPDRREELHYLIDRKNNYYYIPHLHFPRPNPSGKRQDDPDWPSHHTDTLLDGELLWDTYPDGRRVLKYLVFDCLVLDGVSLVSKTLDKRLGGLREGILEPYNKLLQRFPDDCQQFVFRLEEKNTQRSYGTKMMFREVIPDLKHGSDGLIFTCRETPYHYGTDEHILKWKPAWENTIDFRLDLRFPPLEGETNGMQIDSGPAAQKEIYDYDALPDFVLHVGGKNSEDVEFGKLFATTEEWEKMKAWAVHNDDGLDGQVIECHKDTEGRWRFNRFREDKSDANHISVALKVLESIEDAVSEKDLMGSAYDVKKAWKEREAQRETDLDTARRQQRMKSQGMGRT